MKFKFYVAETSVHNKIYVIEADTYEQAEHKAMSGDTVDEIAESSFPDVINREITGEIEGVEQ